jgi:hypothetical protein
MFFWLEVFHKLFVSQAQKEKVWTLELVVRPIFSRDCPGKVLEGLRSYGSDSHTLPSQTSIHWRPQRSGQSGTVAPFSQRLQEAK